MPGFLPIYWDAKGGKVWMEIDRWGTEILYYPSLAAGVGSNDLGLDRGRLSGERIVRFERVGPKVLMVEPNYRFRALTTSAPERRAVEEAFARSVLWGFAVEAEDGSRVLVDATAFFLRDAVDVAGTLRSQREGEYQVDATRSAVYLPRTRNFPRNTEVEATLTFTGRPQGRFLPAVAPTASAVTVRQHHSFVELPPAGYQTRAYDPRSGYNGIEFADYASDFTQPIRQRFITRHRLKKKNPAAPASEAEKPIVYYLDPGTPEPIRSALLDGARWWNQAFEAAGYRDAYRVEMLPEDADPLDIRYNVIQWVHRSTRGWSYGSSVIDPRTGEILKGHVTLGSLRVRQDYLIAEGLLSPYETGKPVPAAMKEMALARLRQLSAHEVGHTLGLAHNYISSTRDRASVMDYPHPLVQLSAAGVPDLKDAYTTEIGAWDKVAITWGYQDFASGTNESKYLSELLRKAYSEGVFFLTDQDARPAGSLHPRNHLWDNGSDAAAELTRVMDVRKRALERFSANNIREGEPMSTLADALVPIYLMHRYQTEAASKVVGGLEYTYALRGDGQLVTETVPGTAQRAALKALLGTLQPAALRLPESLLKIIPPRAYGFGPTRESFGGRIGLAFDPLAAAESSAALTIGLLLHPERASRLVEYHARDAALPGLLEVVDALVGATWKSPRTNGMDAELQRVVQNTVLRQMMSLSADASALPQARAEISLRLDEITSWLKTQTAADASWNAHYRFAAADLRQFREDPSKLALPKPIEAPPGQPIGCDW